MKKKIGYKIKKMSVSVLRKYINPNSDSLSVYIEKDDESS